MKVFGHRINFSLLVVLAILAGGVGGIYDLEGDHEHARTEFRKSGKLRSDPFWHLLMATSWGMSDKHEEGLAEVRRAIEKGAEYGAVDFYYGRALHRVGDYEQATIELNKALRSRKGHVQVMRELVDVYYAQGQFGEAAKYAALCGIVLLRWFPIPSLRHFGQAIHGILLHLILGLSKRIWPISRRIHILKKLHIRICSPAQPESTLGEMLIKRGHYKFAEKHLQKACEVLPDSARVLTNLSGCLAFQGKRVEAIEKCEMAIRCARDESVLRQLKQQKSNLEREPFVKLKRTVWFDYRG